MNKELLKQIQQALEDCKFIDNNQTKIYGQYIKSVGGVGHEFSFLVKIINDVSTYSVHAQKHHLTELSKIISNKLNIKCEINTPNTLLYSHWRAGGSYYVYTPSYITRIVKNSKFLIGVMS